MDAVNDKDCKVGKDVHDHHYFVYNLAAQMPYKSYQSV
jgi:hypothetical protein